jgi:hypothetical protein
VGSAISSCRRAGGLGGAFRSRLANSNAVGGGGEMIGRLVPKNIVGGGGGGVEKDSAVMKRKAAAGDRCDSLSRAVRQKGAGGKNSAAAVSCEDEPTPPQRAPSEALSEELSDATAKPATPDPAAAGDAATGGAEVAQGAGGAAEGEDDVDTAAAIKGVLEGLALDGSAGDDNVDIPDGVLAMPLLRHQRRALSWMQRREAKGSAPRGGLLADDQGLGKTFSTIALIASNPPPPRSQRAQRDERPVGGTLVVCPTSVLRQWQRELASKLTTAAGLKVLVHHGGAVCKLNPVVTRRLKSALFQFTVSA